jgi:hypothetical protein
VLVRSGVNEPAKVDTITVPAGHGRKGRPESWHRMGVICATLPSTLTEPAEAGVSRVAHVVRVAVTELAHGTTAPDTAKSCQSD